jgi:hypothetical protein
MMVRTAAGCVHAHWAVDARKLARQDKQAVSPVFQVDLPEHGPTPFKIVLHSKAVVSDGKKGAGFLRVKGRGRVVLKCESQLPDSCSDIAFRVGVGRDNVMQPFRGPSVQNFFEHSSHGLPTTEEEWDFSASIDDNNLFVVTLEIAPKSVFLANPNIWWAECDVAE